MECKFFTQVDEQEAITAYKGSHKSRFECNNVGTLRKTPNSKILRGEKQLITDKNLQLLINPCCKKR